MDSFPIDSLTRTYTAGTPRWRIADSGVVGMPLGIGAHRIRDALGQPIWAVDCRLDALSTADMELIAKFYADHRASAFYWTDPIRVLTYAVTFDRLNPPQIAPRADSAGRYDVEMTLIPAVPTAVADTLVAHWLMNDNDANTTVADDTGNGHDGVATENTSGLSTTGKIGTALQFAIASAQYVKITDHADLRMDATGGTVCCWVKWDGDFTITGGFSPRIWARASYTGLIITEANGRLTGRSAGAEFRTDASQGVVSGAWVHVAVVFDPVAGTRRIYVNGVDKTTSGVSGPMPASTASDFFIAAATAAGGYFGGAIDDFRVYSRPLTAAEIRAIYNGGSGTESEIVA